LAGEDSTGSPRAFGVATQQRTVTDTDLLRANRDGDDDLHLARDDVLVTP
jgi:hypothetical protein